MTSALSQKNKDQPNGSSGFGQAVQMKSAQLLQPLAMLSDKIDKRLAENRKSKIKIPQDFRPEGFRTT
ncbi:hypothetical protein hmeg3_13850 [Herbaspirillum sp. meg3]|jgi:hypothetical protein|nr:hypothetical protein hmeg3_13850 [Herbaspirillum sp. meg3]